MTTTMSIDADIYRRAQRFAISHHKQSVEKMVENYFLTFLPSDDFEGENAPMCEFSEEEQKHLSHLPPSFRKLYGCASSLNDYRDPNDDRFNYLMEKYK